MKRPSINTGVDLHAQMCGIFGIIRTDGSEISKALRLNMQTAVRSRGPDHSGHYSSPGVFLGMNRLAIIDLVRGNQPIFNEDRSLLIFYNGELYNHPELRAELKKSGHIFQSHSDTETVLHAFEEYGPDCLTRFNGMFALAIFNTVKQELFLARDRLGIKPLYLAPLNQGVAFASEAKALIPVLDGKVCPDWTAISRFFTFGYVPSPDSPFKGIRKFPAGHYAWVKGNDVQIKRYWKPTYGLGELLTFEAARKELAERLRRAVIKEMISDVPIGIFLSGGLDSSAVAAFASMNGNSEIHSYGLRFMETTHDESADAKLVAEHLGLIHHEFKLTHQSLISGLLKVINNLDEPFADPTVIPLVVLAGYTRQHVKVVLTGWGGDEIFAGYPTYRAHKLGALYRKLPKIASGTLIPALVNSLPVSDKYMSFEFKAKRFIRGMTLTPEYQHFIWMGYFDEEGKRRLLQKNILEQIQEDTMAPVRRVLNGMEERDIVSRILHLDACFFLEGNGLFQADRMTMAESLEARVPLLNNDIIDFVNPLPYDVKMPGNRPKELLRRTLASVLPKKILNKPKKGFGPPAAAWINGPLATVFKQLFTRDRIVSQGIFNFNEIQRLIFEHKRRKADHGRNLWAILSFQLWYERFILNSNPSELIIT